VHSVTTEHRIISRANSDTSESIQIDGRWIKQEMKKIRTEPTLTAEAGEQRCQVHVEHQAK
jgi:hypothetical protein